MGPFATRRCPAFPCALLLSVFLAPLAAGAVQSADAERVRIEGTVLLPGGGPARGAIVVTSAGGSAAVGLDGSFALELEVDPAAERVELTAAASGPQGLLIAQQQVEGLRAGAARNAGTLFLALSQGCTPDWIPTFGGQLGVNDAVHALAVFDDGSGAGPALYAGGKLIGAAGKIVKHIARWDGQGWSPLGSGMNGDVHALIVFDDGSGAGPALYAGGDFTAAGGQSAKRVARWDGQAWSALGSGMTHTVSALTVFDDGSGAGPALYAGGDFATAGDQPANRIARWDGQGWSALGSGLDAEVLALAVFDDGSGAGPALYAGGQFVTSGGLVTPRIAKWDGQGWSSLAGGMNMAVHALTVFDDGSGTGPRLCAGGAFTLAGSLVANRIAAWDGQGWSSLGGGLNGPVHALIAFDDGSGAGPVLCAGGDFTLAGGQPANRIAAWDGLGWSAFGSGLGQAVLALAAFDDGLGAAATLYAGGEFTGAAIGGPTCFARWDGQGWSLPADELNDSVEALAVFDDGFGSGPMLYAAGFFTGAGPQGANWIARWDGHDWNPLAGGTNGWVRALTVFDSPGPAGPRLYAGGNFTTAGGVVVNGVARWDGLNWAAVGEPDVSQVFALAVFDDGSGAGPALYAGGGPPENIQKWNGQDWIDLDSGLNNTVHSLAVFDDGSGAALYAGGVFTSASFPFTLVNRIARWDGKDWSSLGSGVSSPLGFPSVSALAVFDDGSGAGPALYAGGEFTIAGGQDASGIARWDGQTWSALGSGIGGAPFPRINALAVHDDGSGAGPALYAGGKFLTAGGLSAQRIAKWDGQAWSSLAIGVNGPVSALAVFDDGSGAGPALLAGGPFNLTPGGDSFLARWGCPPVDILPGCAGNPTALSSLSPEPPIGSTFSVSLSSSELAAGLGLLFLGADGTDAAGCGASVPGLGELLLATFPAPIQVGSGSLTGGQIGFALPVPDVPALVGIEVALQGAVVGVFAPGTPIKLSNALLVVIMP